MDETELEQYRALLGVASTATPEELERAFLKKNFALIKGNTGDEAKQNVEIERQRLRSAHEKLAARIKEGAPETKAPKLPERGVAKTEAEAAWDRNRVTGAPIPTPIPTAGAAPKPRAKPALPASSGGTVYHEAMLLRFDSWPVNFLVPPLLLGLVWLMNHSGLGFLLRGFHVWMHEFGHATAAWMCGFRATPLPFGWTPVEPVHSHFVYGGLLVLFGILFVAGWKERKIWPMIAAVALVGLQFYMTWVMSDFRQEFWWSAFGGVGGEFYLSTLFMMFFWVQLPDKFRWGACRYVFFFIGATALLNIWERWGDIYRGIEEIPFGSMINGEDDQGGDMNKLMDGFGWKKFDIRRNYLLLGYGCWAALGLMWLIFAVRLNKAADWVTARFSKAKPVEE